MLLAIVCFLPLMAISQVKYGIKAGTTLASYRSSTGTGVIPDYRTLAGFQVGAFTETVINNYFSLQPELLFSTRGAKVKLTERYTVPGSTGFETVQTNIKGVFTPLYVDLPVYLKVGFTSVGSDKFTIGAGPLFSYGVGGKAKFNGSVNWDNGNQDNFKGDVKLFFRDKLVLKDENGNEYSGDEAANTLLKRFDVGISCFVAYEFNARVALNLNYQYGLKNISEDPNEDIWNRCLAISLSMSLDK